MDGSFYLYTTNRRDTKSEKGVATSILIVIKCINTSTITMVSVLIIGFGAIYKKSKILKMDKMVPNLRV